MLADARRIRLLAAGGLILAAAVVLRLLTGVPDDDPGDPTVDATGDASTSVAGEASTGTDPAPEAVTDGDEQQAEVDQALQVAETFAAEYLTWDPDEAHADRLARLTAHVTASLAEDLRVAHDHAGDDQDLAQSVDVDASQTLTVRRHQIEATVAADIVSDDAEPVPTNLTVVLRQESGRWAVDDLR